MPNIQEDTDALYLNQELLVEIKALIDDINDSKLHHLRECATLIHDINKGQSFAQVGV